MAKQFQVVSMATQEDLCNWEVINQSDLELDDDVFDTLFDVESLDSLSSFSLSEDEEEKQEGPTNDDLDDAHDHHDDKDDDLIMGSPSPSPSPSSLKSPPRCVIRRVDLRHVFDVVDLGLHQYSYDGHEENDDGVDEDDESDDGYDIDDELVPWEVKNRFERQRIRKLGKRAFAKMAKSKKSAVFYTKPGCVRGKHGLGLKAF